MSIVHRILSLLRGEVPGKLRYVADARSGRPGALITREQFTRPQRRAAARRQVIDHLLRTVAASPWREHLVLRGSLLLKAWLGDAAREPFDVDWAVVPATLSASQPPGELLVDRLCENLRAHRRPGEPLVMPEHVRVRKIWVYSDSPGLRATFPWRHDDLRDAVQMDFSFGDTFLIPPAEADVPTGDGGTVRLLTATREQSLLWKLHWLDADDEPRGKDLYDATLLAEALAAEGTPLPPDLLRRALAGAAGDGPSSPAENFAVGPHVDWEAFRVECPAATGTAGDWEQRLLRALSATFGTTDGS